VYARTREEIARKLAQLISAQQEGIPLPVERETVATFFASWLDGARSTLRPRTWERYEEYVRVHVVPGLGRAPLQRLQPQQLQRFYQDRLDAGLSSTTVHQMHAVIHRALAQAVRWNLVTRNIADLVDPPRRRHHAMRVLSADEVRRLLDAVRGTRSEALLTLAVTTGMRQGELLALRWRDVDLDVAQLSVAATVQRSQQHGLVVAEPKTARSRRMVALTEGAVQALQRHRAAVVEERLRTETWTELDLVFPNRVGRHQEAGRLMAEYRRTLERAGLPRIRFHDLRHTAASLMLARGVHPKIASEMLGHATIAITLDLYSHVTPTMQREAAATLDRLIWG
jgi:integrase